ncbi:hypothetical protein HanIR_Chr09g0413551 [Helianthus annuus]|nr:hypothetical protein HanIR_Chr09g0413551 [Helianthus annuus]
MPMARPRYTLLTITITASARGIVDPGGIQRSGGISQVRSELFHIHIRTEQIIFRSEIFEASRRCIEGVRDQI